VATVFITQILICPN